MTSRSSDVTPEFLDLSEPIAYSSYQQHIGRYIFARKFVHAKVVLDIACGTGYGSDYLADRASCVVCCDLSERALQLASTSQPNVHRVRADAAHIPCKDSVFHVVTSYETIEHLDKDSQLRFLSELKRVLSPEGVLICSTPRREVVNAIAGQTSKWCPYHQHELTLDQFTKLISKYFLIIELYGQDYIPFRSFMRAKIAQLVGRILGKQTLNSLKRILFRLSISREEATILSPYVNENVFDQHYAPRRFLRATQLSPLAVLAVAGSLPCPATAAAGASNHV